MTMLNVKNITKTYMLGNSLWGSKKTLQAVKDVSLTLEEGSCLGIVGESGCGKSTLAKMILGLEKPDRGNVFFLGKDLFRVTGREQKELRREMQVVFQDSFSAVNPKLPVGKIVGESLKNHRRISPSEERKHVQGLLEIVGLNPGDMDKYPHQFSGGQLQRINIARAIALKPKLIVLDEAVASLDVSVQAQILNLLADLKEEFNLSYIFISHNILAVNYVSDCLAVMYMGEIVELIEDINLIDKMQHPYSNKLLSSVLPDHPRCRKKLKPGFDEPVMHGSNHYGCSYLPRCEIAGAICHEKVPVLCSLKEKHRIACHNASGKSLKNYT